MNKLIEWLNKRAEALKKEHGIVTGNIVKAGKGGKLKQTNDTLHFIETHYGNGLKFFKCTAECKSNGCYVETLLVVAESKEDAHQQIVDSRKDKYTEKPCVNYTCQLQEIDLDLSKKGILVVGHGESESDHGFDD
jgi:hypothetical protein